MSHKEELLRRIESREARVGIVGLGYVGLPLAVEFAEAGFTVIGVDVTEEKVAMLNNGESYVGDIPSERLAPLVKNGKFSASVDYGVLKDVDAVSICVPTPLRKTKDPDMSYVIKAVDSVTAVAHDGMLIILESTTYPGTTEELVEPKLRDEGFIIGDEVFIAFSPERIDPSNPTYGVRNTPKVVGGVTPACSEVAMSLYQTAVDLVVSVSSPTAAEMVKLLENTFRAVNIGLVNEIALMCDKLGINVWEVIDAAKTKPFGFMPFYPGPGLGGHCIPIDPLYLSWKLKTLNYTARFIELASEINTSMPAYVVTKIADALNEDGKSVKGSKVVVIGVAYKRDVDDMRESPALDVLHLLLQKGAQVSYYDPHVPSLRLEDGHMLESEVYNDELLSGADCVVIITDHTSINWSHVTNTAKVVVDSRNATAKASGSARIVSL